MRKLSLLAALCAGPFFVGAPVSAAPAVAPALAKPDFDPAAVALLEQSVEAYKNLDHLSQDFTSVELVNGETNPQHSGGGTFIFSRPRKVRLESKVGANTDFAISDGTTFIAKESEGNRYWSFPAAGDTIAVAIGTNVDAGGLVLGPILRGESPLSSDEAWPKWERAVPFTVAGFHGVELTEDKTSPDNLGMVMRIYFDSATHLISRLETEVSAHSVVGTPPRSNGPIVKYSYLTIFTPNNKPITPASFQFVKPAGATLAAVPLTPEPDYYDKKLVAGAAPYALKGVTLAGAPISLDNYKGRVVLLDFWATWCGPCVAELPNVKSNYAKYHAQGFDVVAVSLDENRQTLSDFVKARALPWPQIFDGKAWKSANAQTYGVHAIPFTLLIGKDGKIAAVNPRGKKLEPAIEAALKG